METGLAHFRAQHAESGVPSGLQRELLEEACSPSELQATANLRGCRLAATEADGIMLVAHPIGQIGELLCLSELAQTSEGRFQVLSVMYILALTMQPKLLPAAFPESELKHWACCATCAAASHRYAHRESPTYVHLYAAFCLLHWSSELDS